MSAPAAEQPKEHIPYRITSQEETQQLTPDSRFVKVWRVSFESTSPSYHGSIEVPESEFNAAKVDQLIEEKLESIMSVHELGAEPHPENLAEPGE